VGTFERTVFINCPFDDEYAPLLEAAIFCIVYLDLTPRLANERLESGENRLDKIVEMIRSAQFSIHDLSRCRATTANDYFRMNMPFEYGIDVGFRRGGGTQLGRKKFLIFEQEPHELRQAMSDVSGQDVEFHKADYEIVIKRVRDFFRVEAGIEAPGSARLKAQYVTFQEWMTKKKLHEGHTERDALNLPTRERIDEMLAWVALGKPAVFSA
jgi:hypothetical protein